MSKKPAAKKPASKLGRGLSALMEDIAVPEQDITVEPVKLAKNTEDAQTATHEPAATNKGIYTVSIDKLERNPDQPRRHFDKELLQELSNSIKDKGVLQPILVRSLPSAYASQGRGVEGRYQIVAGERRWLAAAMAGLDAMPVFVRELSDRDVLEIGVVENVQRADLNPIEEAMAYKALKDQFGRTQEDISNAIGKSRSHVANCLRLLSLPVLAREYLADGHISAGHARAILAAPDPQALAEAIVSKDLSVREAEKWVRLMQTAARDPKSDGKRADADTRFIEKQLSEHLGLKIKLNHKNPGGVLNIKYASLEELEDLVSKLRGS
ncbi:MAG: chromosome partitioning protein ParB [Robiginitomaculum sp.]|nr:MAG: chromosome partitioning protein ParB [Robiginitomaculum sp.]